MLGLLDGLKERRPKRTRRDAVVEREHGLDEAKRILERGLEILGLRPQDLAALAKGDQRKAAIAAEIRRRTTVPNQWIAEVLHLGHFSRVSHCVRKRIAPKLAKQLETGLA